MTTNPAPTSPSRPRSPWSGSQHEAEHRWQLDHAITLDEVANLLTALAAELIAADRSGWTLAEPLRDGRLRATRPSRRQRRHHPQRNLAPPTSRSFPSPSWRVRVVDQGPVAGLASLDTAAADSTPVLEWTGRHFQQLSGPELAPCEQQELARQIGDEGLRQERWGVARARVGPNLDLVADGSALRVHAVRGGTLVRTSEALLLSHAADGATHLLQAATAYQQLAETATAMAAAGGCLSSTDGGFVEVRYEDVWATSAT